MAEPLIQIVDENDQPIGVARKEEAWQDGLIHRIVHIIVKDEKDRILLQKRGSNMQLWPNRWTDSASGHVDQGEDWEEAARRELAEEIGLEVSELTELGTFFQDTTYKKRILKRFNRYYSANVLSDTRFTIQESELSQLKWFSVSEVNKLLEENPDNFTPNFIKLFELITK